jgi:hypothetical protein
MEVALTPSLNVINSYSGGGQTLRPSTFDATSGQGWAPSSLGGGLTQSTSGYHDPALAIDGPGAGVGTVSGTVGLQTIIGLGTIFTTQLSAGTILVFSTGEQVTVQSVEDATNLTITEPLRLALSGASFTFTNPTISPAPESTMAWGFTGDNYHVLPGTSSTPVAPRINTCIWKFTSNLAATGRVLSVLHNGSITPANQGPNFGADGALWEVEYSLNGGSSWAVLGGFVRHQPFENAVADVYTLSDGFNMTNQLWVRATVSSSIFTTVSGHWLDCYHRVFDIKVSTGASGAYTASNDIQYGISEVYVDSDGVEHQSNMSPVLNLSASGLQNATSIVLNLPRPINPLAQNFIVWRSVDTPGGGYPVMYRVGNPSVNDTTWTDNLTTRPDDTAAIALLDQYKILEILYPTGESTFASYYSKPPLAYLTLPFQGCLCYFPSDPALARRVYYSLSATVSLNSLEQVPEQYYLDFQTPFNDVTRSGAITNGGRTMLVFFENYTMMVNYLPTGADPGGFNNSVKEYVSNVRGCSGRLACVEFTIPSTGQTRVASVDSLGLWITNGVNTIEEWSQDLDWSTTFAGVDLSLVELYDKPHKRRLEMLFTATNGTRQEYHFFYGRMKQGFDGKELPIITGPHTTGTRCRHYTVVSDTWVGYSGDATATGRVFTEDTQASDDSHGYDSTGIVPWQWHLNDMYVGGIQKAHIADSANIKFADDPVKDFTMVGTFTRDSGTTETVEKIIVGDHTKFPKQIYWHQYCDRHSIGFKDLTNTASPPFISYVLKTRSAGGARDK